jgi:hypothetical protein
MKHNNFGLVNDLLVIGPRSSTVHSILQLLFPLTLGVNSLSKGLTHIGPHTLGSLYSPIRNADRS